MPTSQGKEQRPLTPLLTYASTMSALMLTCKMHLRQSR